MNLVARLQNRRSIYQNQLFYDTRNKQLEIEIKNRTNINSTENIKYLEINLRKYVQDLYSKKY